MTHREIAEHEHPKELSSQEKFREKLMQATGIRRSTVDVSKVALQTYLNVATEHLRKLVTEIECRTNRVR